MTFDGQVAIVTGAAGGVGGEVVRLLRESGAFVVAGDIDPRVLELEAADDGIVALVGDACLSATADRAVGMAVERFGRLDIVVNNAARLLIKPTVETSDDEWDEVMTVNVRSVFVHSRAAMPVLMAQRSGAIVNMASISGLVGLANQAAYSASKGAIVQLTRQLAIDLAPHGVRVNAVAPGAIDTRFLRDAIAGAPDIPAVLAAIAADHPLGRIAEPAEIAEVVVFLASPAASMITGTIVSADGGYVAR